MKFPKALRTEDGKLFIIPGYNEWLGPFYDAQEIDVWLEDLRQKLESIQNHYGKQWLVMTLTKELLEEWLK